MFHRLAAVQSRLAKRDPKISFEWHLLYVHGHGELDLGRVRSLLLQLSLREFICGIDLYMRKLFRLLPWSFPGQLMSDVVLWEQFSSVRRKHTVYSLLQHQLRRQHLTGRVIIVCISRSTATGDDPTAAIRNRVLGFSCLAFVATTIGFIRDSASHIDSIGTDGAERCCIIVGLDQSGNSHSSSHICPFCCSVAKYLLH